MLGGGLRFCNPVFSICKELIADLRSPLHVAAMRWRFGSFATPDTWAFLGLLELCRLMMEARALVMKVGANGMKLRHSVTGR